MTCDAIISRQPNQWVEDRPFLLWDLGTHHVLDHWMDVLFRSNATLRLWLEAPDERVYAYVCETFPINRRVQVATGPPTSRPEACTFLDSTGNVVIRRGAQLTHYLPKQPASQTWFAMAQRWLDGLQKSGSKVPELEHQISPGVYVGHHCSISKDTVFHAPCWVGSGTTIHGATVGPRAVVGENCVISHGATVSDTYLITGTYVSPQTKMSGLAAGPAGIITHATASCLFPSRSVETR
jgi:hypothetical protein